MCEGVAASTVPSMVRFGGGRGVAFPIAVLAALACACLLAASPASLGADGAAHSAGAKVKRSKVCKKKRQKAILCKKRRGSRASSPAVPRSVMMTWDSSADINLQVYDLDGHRAGTEDGVVVNEIPGATHSGDDTDGFGPETFSDPWGRRVGYLVCYVSGPQADVTLADSGYQGGRYTATPGPPVSPSGHPEAYTVAVGWGYLPVGAHC